MQNIYIIFNISITTYIFIISFINIENLCIFVKLWWVNWSIVRTMWNIDHFFIILILTLILIVYVQRRCSNSASHIGRFYLPAPPVFWLGLVRNQNNVLYCPFSWLGICFCNISSLVYLISYWNQFTPIGM